MFNFEKLEVWQKAIDFADIVYDRTQNFPSDERFGLTIQMQRAAVSVASNIAEGEGRRTWRDRAHFYLQARGSLHELETQIIISNRLRYCDDVTHLTEQCQKVGQLINGSLRNLEKRRIAVHIAAV